MKNKYLPWVILAAVVVALILFIDFSKLSGDISPGLEDSQERFEIEGEIDAIEADIDSLIEEDSKEEFPELEEEL